MKIFGLLKIVVLLICVFWSVTLLDYLIVVACVVFPAALCVQPHRLSGFCLFVQKAVNGDNYSKQNTAATTHNYATDANYRVSY